MLSNLTIDLRRQFKDVGYWLLVLRLLQKIGDRLFKQHTSIWLEKDLNDGMRAETDKSDLDICDNFDEIVVWMKVINNEYPWIYNQKEISLAKLNGHMIIYGKINGEIVGYTKVALNKIYIRDYDSVFEIAKNKAMFYDTTVLPEYRGKKVPYLIKIRLFEILKNKGIDKIYAHIEPWNIASIKSNQRVGFYKIFINKYTYFLGWKHYTRNPSLVLG